MRIPELYNQKKVVFSLEIFPPKKTTGIDKIYAAIDALSAIPADYISVTYRAGSENNHNFTCDIAKHIKQTYGTEPLAHFACVNSTKEQVNTVIKELKDNGIENVLALRGDINPNVPRVNDFRHADQLAREIKHSSDMAILGACHPEGHCDAPNLGADIENLKYKIGAGVEALISQLFFDNDKFYTFMDRARAKGIEVPVSAGIMPIVSTRLIEQTVTLSSASVPHEFSKLLTLYESDAEALFEAGIDYASKQIIDLIENGVQGIHLYTMNNPEVAKRIYENVKHCL